MPKGEARYLTGTRIQFVSLVDKAANQRVFLTMKEQGCNFANTFEILKSATTDDDGPHFVTGIVYEPDVMDSQGDAMSAEEIEKAERWYMRNARGNDIQHNGVQAEGIWLAECGITKADCVIDGQQVREGTWYITVGVDNPEIRKAIREGALTGFSMGGVTGYVEKAAEGGSPPEHTEESGFMRLLKAIGRKLGIIEGPQEQKETETMTPTEKAEIIAEIRKAQEEETLVEQLKALIEQKKQTAEAAPPPKEEKPAGGALTEERVKALIAEAIAESSGKVGKSEEGEKKETPESESTEKSEGGTQIGENELATLITNAVEKGNQALVDTISKAYGHPQNLNNQTEVQKGGQGKYGALAGLV